MRKQLKEGQKVWSLRFGVGRVMCLREPFETNTWTILIEFHTLDRDGFHRWYDDKGKMNVHERRDLYLKRPVIMSKQRLNKIVASVPQYVTISSEARVEFVVPDGFKQWSDGLIDPNTADGYSVADVDK